MILLALCACITLTVDPLPPATGVDDCVGCVDATLAGEVIALVNGKLTAAETQYTANAVMEDGTVLGASVFLHDPDTTELVKLGNLDLGVDDLGDGALERLTVRDLAWDPDAGLWALGIDGVNDEWLLLHVDVPDWAARNQLLPTISYAFRTTDPIYWEESVSALAFVDGELVLGTQGDAGGAGGRLYRSAVPTGWSVEPAWPDDPEYYADAVLTEPWASFPDGLGLAGDIADTDGEPPLATVRAERSSAGALDENWLWTLSDAPTAAGTTFDVVRNQDVEGLAVIDGVPWGVDTEAVTWRADAARATRGADLSAAFTDPDDGIRLRGAARVVLP